VSAHTERRVEDFAGQGLFEFCCKTINPTARVELHTEGNGWIVMWEDEGQVDGAWATVTKPDAWQAAFSVLDRRKERDEDADNT